MTYTLGAKSRANLNGLHPELIAVIEDAISITTQDFAVFAGARTASEQNSLYRKGRTLGGSIVTSKDGYRNKSNHQFNDATGYGHAVDLVPWDGKKLTWDWDLIWPMASAMGEAARSAGVRLRWGGNWNECMNDYDCTIAGVKEAVDRYKREHAGPDFLDGPHFEIIFS